MELVLNSGIVVAAFTLFYLLVLKKDTFFQWNRAFILFSLLLAAVIPWLTLNLSWWEQKPVVFDFTTMHDVAGPVQGTQVATTEPAFNWMILLFKVYLAGLVIFSVRFLLIIGQVLRIYIRGKKVRSGRYNLVLVDEMINPFSFFNHIYLPTSFYQPGKNLEVILNHESVHQRQWHSADRLLMELFLVYQWFNPLAWLFRKEMILVHEYLADHNLSREQDQFSYQQSLLKHLLSRTTLSLGNNFSAHLKKRIKMMNRSMTPDWQKAKFILAVPLVAILLFTCTQQEMEVFNQMHHSAANETRVIMGKAVDAKTGNPLPGTNILLKGSTIGTVTNLQGEFRLEVPANRKEVVASFIKYNTLSTPLEEGLNHVTLKLSKDEYAVDGSAEFSELPLAPKTNSQPDMSNARMIKGSVTDIENGEPVPGANVIIKGLPTGTVTDLEGNFQLKVPEGYDELIVLHSLHPEMEVEVDDKDINVISKNVVMGFGLDKVDEKMVEGIKSLKVVEYGNGDREEVTLSDIIKRDTNAEVMVGSSEGRDPKVMVQKRIEYQPVPNAKLGELYPESTEVVGYGRADKPVNPSTEEIIKGEIEAGVIIRNTNEGGKPFYLVKQTNGYRKLDSDKLGTINPNSIKSLEVLKSGDVLLMLQKQFDEEDTEGVVIITLKE